MLGTRLSAGGNNIVLPKACERSASIEKQIALYRAHGHRIHVIKMAVSTDTAMRRMLGRFTDTGRTMPTEYLKGVVGDLPSATYRELKAKGAADGYAEISTNDPKPVTDIACYDTLAGSRVDVSTGREPRSGVVRTAEADRGSQPGQAPGEGTVGQGLTPSTAPQAVPPVGKLPSAARAQIRAAGSIADFKSKLRAYGAADKVWRKQTANSSLAEAAPQTVCPLRL